MLSQRNLFNSLKSFALSLDVIATDNDTYIAFLPLAHVLEMLCEMLMVIHGVREVFLRTLGVGLESRLENKYAMHCHLGMGWFDVARLQSKRRNKAGLSSVSYVVFYRKVLKMVEFCHLDSPSTPSATLSTGSATRLPTP